MVKKKLQIPDKIIALPNPDKFFHEKWEPGRNKLNIIHPFRCCLLGNPNVGKTTIIKNILLRAKPEFEEVIVIHCDGDYTKEYDDLGLNTPILSKIPPPEWWKGQVKTLVILDDLEFKQMGKEEKRNLDRLFGFVSTHKNISICLGSQDFFNLPPIVRRCSNLFILWRPNDLDSLNNISRKCGIPSLTMKKLFNNHIKEKRDSLWVDLTDNTPYKIRKNGFEIINII